MRLKAARKRRDGLIAQLEELNTTAEAREWTDEERASYDALLAQVKVANRDIERMEESAEFERTAPAAETYAGDGTQISSTSASGVITRMHDNRQDKPWSSMGEVVLYGCRFMLSQSRFTGGSRPSRSRPAANALHVGRSEHVVPADATAEAVLPDEHLHPALLDSELLGRVGDREEFGEGVALLFHDAAPRNWMTTPTNGTIRYSRRFLRSQNPPIQKSYHAKIGRMVMLDTRGTRRRLAAS